jgi:N utilization substance protein A
MSNELLTVLEYIEQERGISREFLVDAIEKAILSASQKSIHPASKLSVKLDPKSGDIRAWASLEVVDEFPNNDQILLARVQEKMPEAKLGDTIEWEVTPRNFGRIAAQTAKQAIMTRLKEAEKEIVHKEFEDKVGQIVNGVVRHFENGGIVVDLQRAEGIISPKEKIKTEKYMTGERINALLLEINTKTSGPSLILSRTHPNFVRRLFEREVSEIHDGVVEIKNVVREPGERTKISVTSTEDRVDPIGACVGMRGMRVKNIMAELGGERIDIIRYSEDLKEYTLNAMQPAKPSSIELNEDEKIINVYVPKDQSRLAFGKRAQNVRLCSKLVRPWTINIIVEQEDEKESFEDQMERMKSTLAEQLDVVKSIISSLFAAGYTSLAGLSEITFEELMDIDEMSEDIANTILGKVPGEKNES